MSTRFSIPSKMPTLNVPKVPDSLKLPSTNLLSKGILSSPPAETTTTQSPTGETDEPPTDSPQKEEVLSPNTVSNLKAGRVVYLVMQPVIAVSKIATHISKVRNELTAAIYRFLRGWIDFTTLLGLMIAQHWAVMVDGHYYHLKRMMDDSLALDMSSFSEEAIFLKIPLWKTTLEHEDRAGIAVRILATMMDKSKEIASVRVERDGRVVGQDGFSFKKYRNYIYFPTTGKGGYSAAFNNCQHFVRRFFNQVFVPNGPKDLLEWPAIAQELWFSGLSKATAQDVLHAIKSNNLSVEYILECLLKSGGGAATTDVSKSAVAAEEATLFARDAALSLQKSAGRLVELAEAPVPVTKAVAEKALKIDKAEDDARDEGSEKVTKPTFDTEKTKAEVQVAIDQLNALEEEAKEFAKLHADFELQAKTAKVLVEAYIASVKTASHFTSPK